MNNIKRLFPIAIVLISLMVPPINFEAYNLSLRPELFVCFAWLCLCLATDFTGTLQALRPSLSGKWLIALVLAILASSVYSNFILHSAFALRDITEFIRIGYYFVLFQLSIKFLTLDSPRIVNKLLLILIFILGIMSLLQYWEIGGINAWLTPLYTDRFQMAGLQTSLHRVVGTVGNPNNQGLLFAVAFVLMLSSFIGSKLSAAERFVLLSGLVLAIFVIVLSSSRTALLLAVLGTIYLLFVYLVKFGLSRRSIFGLVGLALIIGCFFIFSPPWYIARVKDGINFASANSYVGRVSQWQDAWSYIKTSPIFGWGSAKSSMITFTDNEYVLVMRRYGLLGLITYIGIWISLFVSLRLKRVAVNTNILAFAGFQAVILMAMVFGITAGLFYNIQMSSVFWVIAASLVAQIKTSGRAV